MNADNDRRTCQNFDFGQNGDFRKKGFLCEKVSTKSNLKQVSEKAV